MLNMIQRQALTATNKKRYLKARKKEKTKILDEFVQSTGYNRSYARLVLGSRKIKPKAARRKKVIRKRIYDAKVFFPLRTIWIAADGICGQRLQPFIPELLASLERNKELKLTPEVRRKLLKISAVTIDRLLAPTKRSYRLKGRATTKPGTLLKSLIPIRTFEDWADDRPGFFETDLVALCGDNVSGDYVNCLNLTDVAVSWIGLAAVMGKGQYRVHKAIDQFRERVPYPILGLDPDNGSEFINWHLKKYCEAREITFTRIRPNKKNDNCYVEQKNYTVVRRFLGYGRYDTERQLKIIQEILRLVEIYVNFFQPVMRLQSKKRVGSKVKKKYDTAKTLYQRLLGSGILTREKESELGKVYINLNPLDLKRKIYRLTEKLSKTLR